MLYRTFEKINEKVSLLGLGGMRFAAGEDGKTDEEAAVRLIRQAIDGGINYLDTAYTYHDGRSEVIFGRALKDGYREKVLVADKLPIWLVEKESDVRRFFQEQLERLDVDCIDMYLIHSIDAEGWLVTKECRVLPILEELRSEGRIRYIGFSFHDEAPLFREVVDAWNWDFCQIQLNYVDTEFQAGLAGLQYAAAKGMGVVIMEPLKGGRLTDAVPKEIQRIWNGAPIKRTPAEWAFKWLAAHPAVTTILSGMSNGEQLEENLRLFSREDLPELTSGELTRIRQAADLYRSLIKYPCTECRYCMPCPSGVNIPRIIRYYNDWCAYEQNPSLKEEYLGWLEPTEQASACTRCGHCEAMCPQHLPVMTILEKTAEAFGQ